MLNQCHSQNCATDQRRAILISVRSKVNSPVEGLGRLVEVQGGQILAQPRQGGGTEFWFTLPVAHDG